ncbi:amidophosphoribosyltransferase [Candidatus Bathyarchaeota archaeon]|nr:amidophosphoribosyltransferase [Candidatus Bathyarchaeota archaeon]
MSLAEKCGVLGVYTPGEPVFPYLYWGMLAQNHRGHQSHGFATYDGGLKYYTGLGLIPPMKEPGKESRVKILAGSIGIANVRYTTSGSGSEEALCMDAMPIMVQGEKHSMVLSFNGNIVNVRELQSLVGVPTSASDTHALAALLINEYEARGRLADAVRRVMETVDGAYSIAGILDDGTLFAFKDPHGVKPLCYGFTDGVYAFSSESTGLAINGIEWQREIRPGELMMVHDGMMSQLQVVPTRRQAFCAFEYAYFSRPDTRYNGKYVYQCRRGFGAALARIYGEAAERCEMVVCLPESANDAAYGFHEESGLPWEMALRRHRYVSQRAFITDGVDRQTVIYRKLNILAPMIVGKRVAVVDDSIVRGDTMRGNVKRLRDAGAREVHVFVTYPRIIGPCFYGIDMSSYGELIGARLEPEEIAREIGADSVNYLPIDEYIKETGMRPDQLCLGCITDTYPTDMANKLSQSMKEKLSRGAEEKGRIYES